MNTIKRNVVIASAFLSLSTLHTFAIAGLQLSVQSSNVVLSWPSVDGSGATYIVQYRSTLNATDSWQTLDSAWPTAAGTNVTFYVHEGIVQYPPAGAGGGTNGGNVSPFNSMSQPAGSSRKNGSNFTSNSITPLVKPANGSGAAVPLALYPPGLDLSGFVIFDPATQAWTSGNGRSVLPADSASSGDMQPMDESTNGTNQYIGFYRVVRDGIHLFSITNGAVLSGRVPLPIEFGDADTNRSIAEIFLSDNDSDDDLPGSTFPDFPLGAGVSPNGVWDTTQVTNGTYLLQVGAKLTDEGVYMDNPVAVTVSNVMWLPDPWSVGGQAIYVGVQTAFTNGTWHLAIYDDQNNYLGYLDGTLDANGYCAYPSISGPGFSLDNTDGQGNQNPSTAYTLAMTVQPANAAPPYPTLTNTVLIEPSWNFAPTYAVTCYMQVFNPIKSGYEDVQLLMQMIWSVEDAFHPNLLGSGQVPFQVQTLGDWGTVVSNLRNNGSRDFIYFGHGSGTVLGPDSTTSITTTEIESYLQNNSKDPLTATNRHPYRFVYLDGCGTADGDWPQVFGIPKKKGMVITDFTDKRGIRPRAFFGWNRKKIFSDVFVTGLLYPDFIQWRTTFWQSWAQRNNQGGPLNTLTQAATAADTNPNGTHNTAGGGKVIYGASDLVIDY